MEISYEKVKSKKKENQAVFVVWSAPTFGSPRSRLLAKELKMPDPIYFFSRRLEKPITAPLRYAMYAIRTLWLLIQNQPRVVFVQSPPSFAVVVVALYCVLTHSRYIVDAHSAALQKAIWTRPAWLYNWIARQALATLVTDDFFRDGIEAKGGKAVLLRDPVVSLPVAPPELNGTFRVTVVNTFYWDEPLQEVLAAAAGLPDVQFFVTGKIHRADPALIRQAPGNVVFTDFLSDTAYHQLLCSSHAVMSLTTRDHTLQCGACEALSRKRPIITSSWPLLREYFSQGTVHVDNTSTGIRQGVEAVRKNYRQYEAEIADLFALRYSEWKQRIMELRALIS